MTRQGIPAATGASAATRSSTATAGLPPLPPVAARRHRDRAVHDAGAVDRAVVREGARRGEGACVGARALGRGMLAVIERDVVVDAPGDQVHVTVLPAATLRSTGEKKLLPTVTPVPPPPEGPAGESDPAAAPQGRQERQPGEQRSSAHTNPPATEMSRPAPPVIARAPAARRLGRRQPICAAATGVAS